MRSSNQINSPHHQTTTPLWPTPLRFWTASTTLHRPARIQTTTSCAPATVKCWIATIQPVWAGVRLSKPQRMSSRVLKSTSRCLARSILPLATPTRPRTPSPSTLPTTGTLWPPRRGPPSNSTTTWPITCSLSRTPTPMRPTTALRVGASPRMPRPIYNRSSNRNWCPQPPHRPQPRPPRLPITILDPNQ